MFVYLCAKFEVSSIILTSFKGGRGGITPTSKRTPKKPTQIRVKEVSSLFLCDLLVFYVLIFAQ